MCDNTGKCVLSALSHQPVAACACVLVEAACVFGLIVYVRAQCPRPAPCSELLPGLQLGLQHVSSFHTAMCPFGREQQCLLFSSITVLIVCFEGKICVYPQSFNERRDF